MNVKSMAAPSVSQKQNPFQQSKYPQPVLVRQPPVVFSTVLPSKCVSTSSSSSVPTKVRDRDEDLDLCDAIQCLSTSTPRSGDSKQSRSTGSSRGSSDPKLNDLLSLAVLKSSLKFRPSVASWPRKYYMTAQGDVVPLIAGSSTYMGVPSQGNGVSNRNGDTIWAHHVDIDLVVTYFPYTVTAIGQCNASASACAHETVFVFSTSYIPATAGTGLMALTYGVSPPPTSGDGWLFSQGAQGTAAGNLLQINPAAAFKGRVHKIIHCPQIDSSSGNELTTGNILSLQGANAASIAGTQSVKRSTHKFRIPLNYKVAFSPASTQALFNLFAMTVYTNYTQAAKHQGGFDCMYSFVSKFCYSDMDG